MAWTGAPFGRECLQLYFGGTVWGTARPGGRGDKMSKVLWSLTLAVVAAGDVAGDLRPNVVVILADDLGYGDLGCFENRAYKTPHLDRMAKEGCRLTSFYAPVPFCAPTRASLLT